MSRRANPTFTNQHFRDFSVICTRRGTHKPKRLGTVVVHRSLDFETNPNQYRLQVDSHHNEDRMRELFEGPPLEYQPGDYVAPSHHATKTEPLSCSKCNFNAPVRRDKLDVVVQKLVKNGIWRLDISYLPDML